MDWRGLIFAGLHKLRLHPAQFWALTPVELQIMLGTQSAIAPMKRGQLEALLRDFPDLTRDEIDG